jgi:hypothetical protein
MANHRCSTCRTIPIDPVRERVLKISARQLGIECVVVPRKLGLYVTDAWATRGDGDHDGFKPVELLE